MTTPPTPQTIFGETLQRTLGQAMTASGYALQPVAMHQARGLFRYDKRLDNDVTAYAEFQLLYYTSGGPSRFRVNLLRNTGAQARARTNYADRVDTTLSQVVWDIFGVRQLDAPEHWWVFRDMRELGAALVEASKLLIGFGLPWLEGTLKPEDM
jgi:hypothetical protein